MTRQEDHLDTFNRTFSDLSKYIDLLSKKTTTKVIVNYKLFTLYLELVLSDEEKLKYKHKRRPLSEIKFKAANGHTIIISCNAIEKIKYKKKLKLKLKQ